MTLYLGLISGTSMDGIDAALLEIGSAGMQLRAASAHSWPAPLLHRLRQAAESPEQTGLTELGLLDASVGAEFAAAAGELLRAAGTPAAAVRAVGSHGQTLLHSPRSAPPFSLQVGDPNILAERLGIDVVADFRRRDLAAGGEGAPLMPAFHAAAFGAAGETRAVVNIGGIANVTLLAANGRVCGFDTGPGNCLLDAWARRRLGLPYDHNGAWARSGQVHAALLGRLLAEPYFARPAPKSTGRDQFSDSWLLERLGQLEVPDADVQATLAELTARTIAAGVGSAERDTPRPRRLLICGGGALNADLRARLQQLLPGTQVETTAGHGIAAEHVEAAGFAWLAHRYLEGLTGNLPTVTGAHHAVPLGALYRARAAVAPDAA